METFSGIRATNHSNKFGFEFVADGAGQPAKKLLLFD
jgi:hypothetical protein